MSLMITSLPKEVLLECVSRVPRRYYPTLPLVSKFFRSLIASPELYATRAVMDRTECFLYVIISLTNKVDGNTNDHLYTLRRNPNSTYSLVPITPLPYIPSTFNGYVTVDSKIYVMGGSLDRNTSIGNNALLIDCRFHTTRKLPDMPKEVARSVSYLFNGKIYVICNNSCPCPFTPNEKDMDVMVFDIKAERRESRMRQDIAVCDCRRFYQSAVTWDDKVYFNCFVYDPKEDKWEKDAILKSRLWYGNGGVMEGVLYFCSAHWGKLYAYDFKGRCWKMVKGVERLMARDTIPRTVIYDKKVMVLFKVETDEKSEIWCAVIKVERDQEGEFCGTVEWCGCVLDNGQWPHVKACSPVDV